ncbi:LysM peptidoglycan-binding domain-containing protein [Streptomyces spirodelae]|uniref:LysM peptidoglycan-binding domain-containing protein n=1 Tax=Streptomyces spirodelae TaxID=2812904 RepID=A0ABS3WTZ2_9ACTN|nr:LysM domain-containing protein [Streptomyces spirodelae]MBO8186336.1 LysM peptidoglycan-binding domain-containing protein [Streptomyces spirodelae]
MRKTKIATFGVLTAAAVAVPAAPAFAQEGQSADTHTHTEATQRQGPSAETYEVRPGDTLSEVARSHGTNWHELAERNGLADPDLIYPGQHLTLEEATPQPAPAAPDSAATPGAEGETGPQAQQPAPQPQETPEGNRSTDQAPGISMAENAAKAEIIRRESSGNPNAQNGKYHGLFQTDQPWGRGTVAEQHAGAERYVKERYGSWEAALAFHNAHGWY